MSIIDYNKPIFVSKLFEDIFIPRLKYIDVLNTKSIFSLKLLIVFQFILNREGFQIHRVKYKRKIYVRKEKVPHPIIKDRCT